MQLSRREFAGLAACASSPGSSDQAPPAAPESYLRDVLNELRKTWPNNRTVNIVCHGHSVPAGYARTPEVRPFDAYPHLLHRAIHELYPCSVMNVIITAIGGETSVAGAARFRRDVLPHAPDVLLLDYALNDRRIGLRLADEAWRKMIRAALSRHVRLILLTPTADDSTNLNDPMAPLCQHASQIRRLAAEFRVGLADPLRLFSERIAAGEDVRELLAQSNHPNRRGHELVRDSLLPFFRT